MKLQVDAMYFIFVVYTKYNKYYGSCHIWLFELFADWTENLVWNMSDIQNPVGVEIRVLDPR